MQKNFPESELQKIKNRLEDYHIVFYSFWNMATVVFDDSIPTACVQFCKYSKPILMFNETFWNSLTEDEQHFIVCHECLHVILQHDKRPTNHIVGTNKMLENMAQDIVINEMIVDLFNFDRNNFRNWQKYCWIETCFKNHFMVQRNKDFYYYLDLLIKEKAEEKQTMDDHDSSQKHQSDNTDKNNGSSQKQIDELVEGLLGQLSEEQLEKIVESEQKDKSKKKQITNEAGNGCSSASKVLSDKRKPPKLNITKFIKFLKASHPNKTEVQFESFASENQKYSSIPGVCIPGLQDINKIKQDKFHIMLFMDVSGSCVSYIPDFEKIVKSFEAEDKYFEIEIYTFDDRVKKLDKKNRKYSYGGGTSFKIIGDEVDSFILEHKKHPDGVFVITDGYGDTIKVEKPSKWIWILTPGNSIHYIDKKSHKFQLKDVVYE